MGKRDYYDILGVSKSADAGELKKAYRRLAMKHHPDRNQDDPAAQDKFKEAKLAYEILKDPQKRAVYDQYGHAGIEQQAGGGGGFHADVGDVFGDIFGDIFGSGRRRSGGRSGADLKYDLEMTLEDAVFGKDTEIRVPTYAACNPCDGTGSADGKQNRCTTCNGVGQVRMQQGFFSVQQTCPTCRGKGSTMSNPCTSCHGQGRVREEKTLSVSIPAGVDTGDRIRLSGEGEAGVSGGPAGDLYVEVHVRPHAIFTRDGNDLFCEIPIAYTEATLGGELDLPTLSGSVRLKVPPGTQSNKTFKVRGKGVKSVRSHETGNLMARLVVETPVNLSKRQRELLQEFEATFEGRRQKHSPKSHSWLDGVKQFFENIG